VLVALAVIAAVLSAIGALMAVSARGTRAVERHLALVETARAVEFNLPPRNALAVGSTVGETAGHRWRIDVLPFATNVVDQGQLRWIPQSVVITVRSPGGEVFRIDTVRLRKAGN
jgi:general secretion pathway protein I